MEIAVFSDIHGNYAAFEQCVEYVLARHIHTFIFLGDYLGEFPYPRKTMELIYALKEKSIDRNNEKMLPDHEKTNEIIDKCACKYILCGHTHLQGVIKHSDKTVLNPGAVGVPMHSGGKAQFLILHQTMKEWTPEFISINYDKEKIIKDMQESGLEKAAPYWMQVTKHLILTGEVSHGTVLAKAMQLWKEETGKSSWYNIPDQYWEKAIAELLPS